MSSFGTVSEERFDAVARQWRTALLAHVEDDIADEFGVGVGAVGVAAVEVERGCYLELVISEEGPVECDAVRGHGVWTWKGHWAWGCEDDREGLDCSDGVGVCSRIRGMIYQKSVDMGQWGELALAPFTRTSVNCGVLRCSDLKTL